MDKIEKFLRKLTSREFDVIMLMVEQIEKDYTKIPGIMKLVGMDNRYRVRVGMYRIIFRVSNGKSDIVRIAKRDHFFHQNSLPK